MSSTPDSGVSFKSYGGSAPENYERYFVPTIGTPFARELVEAAALEPGERVLDVACGTGIVTRLAAGRVGAEGSVAGLDINPAMLGVARTAVSDPSIEWYESSAESIPTADGSFDAVLSSLGLQFVPDKAAAAREMHRVLATGGRVAIGTVGSAPFFDILDQALAEHVSPDVAAFVRVVFSLDDPSTMQDLLADAGFSEVRVESKKLTLRLPASAEFLWQYVHSTPLVAAVSNVDEEAQSALEQDVVAGWQPFIKDGALEVPTTALLSTGHK